MVMIDIGFTTTPRKTVNDPRTSCRIAKHFRADHTIAFALRGDAARAAETHGKTEKQKAKDHDPVQGFGSSPQERASFSPIAHTFRWSREFVRTAVGSEIYIDQRNSLQTPTHLSRRRINL
jgi:hypothetical protein